MKVKTFTGIYVSGYPGLEDNIPCFINLDDKEIVVTRKNRVLLFKIPYEKVESVSVDIQKEWSGGRMALGLLVAGPLGLVLFGKKKQKFFGILVRGKDKEGNIVKIPIAFKKVGKDKLLKKEIEIRMTQERGITI